MATDTGNIVKVCYFGGKAQDVCLEVGKTVQDALDLAEVTADDLDGREIRLNKRAADLTDEVFDGDVIVLVPMIEGGA